MAAQTTPKGMSSRLLTMKFMQRAAASSPASTASTPISDESSSKRRKISHSHPVKDDVDTLVDRQAIQAAIDEDERKREDALVKRAAELGDARWVLNIQNQSSAGTAVQKPLQVVQVGYAQIDSPDNLEGHSDSDEDSHDAVPQIRRYNMGKKKRVTEASDSDGENDSDDSSDDSDSSDASSSTNQGGSRATSVKQRSASHHNGYASKRNAEKIRAKEFADKRRQREVKLNNARPKSTGGLSSPSPGGGSLSLSSGGRPMQRQSGSFSFSCHNCGQVGHKAADCKKPKQRSR